jgi:exosortase/archaeosortase family protein
MMPWLQFYIGYPLRLSVAAFAAPLLQLSGLAVFRQGTCLSWGDQLISIDAPCSGIRMLWTGGYLLFTLCLLYRLTNKRTLLAGGLAFFLIFFSNVIRSASLFYLEAGIFDIHNDYAHELVGMFVFAALALAIFFLVRGLARGEAEENRVKALFDQESQSTRNRAVLHRRVVFASAFFLSACLAAGLAPLFRPKASSQALSYDFKGWPAKWEGRSLKPLIMSERELRFSQDFPGKMARFTDGEREIVIRWIAEPSRKVHSASHCLGAYGWKVDPLPLHIDGEGKAWGSFEASLRDQRIRVREQFRDSSGKTWSDLSNWYWDAILDRSTGPWWSVTVAENVAHKERPFP